MALTASLAATGTVGAVAADWSIGLLGVGVEVGGLWLDVPDPVEPLVGVEVGAVPDPVEPFPDPVEPDPVEGDPAVTVWLVDVLLVVVVVVPVAVVVVVVELLETVTGQVTVLASMTTLGPKLQLLDDPCWPAVVAGVAVAGGMDDAGGWLLWTGTSVIVTSGDWVGAGGEGAGVGGVTAGAATGAGGEVTGLGAGLDTTGGATVRTGGGPVLLGDAAASAGVVTKPIATFPSTSAPAPMTRAALADRARLRPAPCSTLLFAPL